MVGGFSFYDRAEVKDILSYLKLVLNPHDSIALGRVVNSPPRGIGKTTMETLERIALTAGISTWDAIARATEDGLLPARALAALGKFRRLIEDARALLGPDFAGKLAAGLAPGDGLAAEYVTEDGSSGPASIHVKSQSVTQNGPEAATDFNPEEFAIESATNEAASSGDQSNREAFRKPGDAVTLPELIKFLNDRSGYIRALEDEATPEAFSRIENLKRTGQRRAGRRRTRRIPLRLPRPRRAGLRHRLLHLRRARHADDPARRQGPRVPACLPRRNGGGPLSQLALAAGSHRPRRGAPPLLRRHDPRHGHARPHPRPLSPPLRLGDARRQHPLALSGGGARAPHRRPGQPTAAPAVLRLRLRHALPATQSLRSHRQRTADDAVERHYSYEDEDQSAAKPRAAAIKFSTTRIAPGSRPIARTASTGNSIDNIASFFAARGQKVPSGQSFPRPKLDLPTPTGKTGLRQGSRVRHPKYGVGTVFRREGDGDDAKITVQFQQHGVKKLVEKFAQLEAL